MQKFLEHRIADRRIIRLIRQWLKAGVVEDGSWSEAEAGTPQGSGISPLLSNVFLHYVFDLWADQWRRRNARGDNVIVRYADDFVMGFRYEGEAKRFLKDLRERFARVGLDLHTDKTRLIEFGRFAAKARSGRGKPKPETSTSWVLPTRVVRTPGGISRSSVVRLPSACGQSCRRSN
jgi:hypothetical protein